MDKKINVVQFLPYFPPHTGGLETHADERSQRWMYKDYGKVINMVFDVGQKGKINKLKKQNINKLIKDKKGKIIGYKNEKVDIYLLPAFDIISGFPFPKFWSSQFWRVLKKISKKDIDIAISRTRFFISSLLAGLWSQRKDVKWIHIEHGSGYIQLSANWKNYIAKIYDKLIGKWIFKKADKVVGVSHACQNFIQNEFVDRQVDVIYRGLDFVESWDDIKNAQVENLKEKYTDKIIVGFLGRLYKRKNVGSLIKAYYELDKDLQDQIQLVLIGGGEDEDKLKKLDKDDKVYFKGWVDFDKALNLQKQFDIHMHTSSPGGGLASTVMQAMFLGPMIVATPYEGAKEVIEDGKNGILLKDDSVDQIKQGLQKAIENIDRKDEFAKANQKIVERELSWEKNIEKYYLRLKNMLDE